MLVNDFTNLMVGNDAPIIHWCQKCKNKTEEFCFYKNMLCVLSVPEFLRIVMVFIQIKYIKVQRVLGKFLGHERSSSNFPCFDFSV